MLANNRLVSMGGWADVPTCVDCARVEDSGPQGSGFGVQVRGAGFRVQSSGCRVQGVEIRGWRAGVCVWRGRGSSVSAHGAHASLAA